MSNQMEQIDNQEAKVDLTNVDVSQLNTDAMNQALDWLNWVPDKEIIKTFDIPNDVQAVILNLPKDKVKLVATEENNLRIIQNISYPNNQNMGADTQKSLLTEGRYDANISINGKRADISYQNKEIYKNINWSDLVEEITYTVYVPARLKVKTQQQVNEDIAANKEREENLKVITGNGEETPVQASN